MNILLLISLLIIIMYFTGDKLLDNYAYNTIKTYMNLFLYGEKITLKGKEKEIIEGLVAIYIQKIINENAMLGIALIGKIKVAYNIYGYLEEFIDFLICDYGSILQANKENISSVFHNSCDNKINQYFVSYLENGKNITIWFSYLDHRVKIIRGSDSFEKLSNKEQYAKLLAILLDIKNGRAKKYNHTNGLENMFMCDLQPEIEFEGQLSSCIIVRELKKK